MWPLLFFVARMLSLPGDYVFGVIEVFSWRGGLVGVNCLVSVGCVMCAGDESDYHRQQDSFVGASHIPSGRVNKPVVLISSFSA